MSERRTIKLVSQAHRQRAHALVDAAPQDYVVAVGEETRTDEQNRLMWPLIKDLREQVEWIGQYGPEETKLRFLNTLEKEMKFLPTLARDGLFPVGQRSSTLSKSQFSILLEIMFKTGADEGVKWSARSEETRATLTQEAA